MKIPQGYEGNQYDIYSFRGGGGQGLVAGLGNGLWLGGRWGEGQRPEIFANLCKFILQKLKTKF